MDPTPGWGLGNAAPAPAGTSAVLVGAGAATATLLGITTVDTATSPPRPAHGAQDPGCLPGAGCCCAAA